MVRWVPGVGSISSHCSAATRVPSPLLAAMSRLFASGSEISRNAVIHQDRQCVLDGNNIYFHQRTECIKRHCSIQPHIAVHAKILRAFHLLAKRQGTDAFKTLHLTLD